MSQVPSDESDVEFASSPSRVIKYRNKLSDFVIDNLTVGQLPSELSDGARNYFKQRKIGFIQKLEEDKDRVANFINSWYGDDANKFRYPTSAFEFSGMNVEMIRGDTKESLDVLSDRIDGVRPNIQMQRGFGQLFVHIDSNNYSQEYLRRSRPEITRRIYLNPKIEYSIYIFDQVIQSANQAGIIMKGKLLDESQEVLGPVRRQGVGEYSLRGDSIVLFAGDDSDRLLQLVESIYKENNIAFDGRGITKAPMEIAEGVAVGDEPDSGSLTSHRSAFLEDVRSEAKKSIAGRSINPSTKVKLFRKIYEEMARSDNINPNNIAFNA